jgi:hypothetical protein
MKRLCFAKMKKQFIVNYPITYKTHAIRDNFFRFILPDTRIPESSAYDISLLLRVADMSLTYIRHKRGPKMNLRGTH